MIRTSAGSFTVGEHVRIERDETRYPSRGSWPIYRGRVGRVASINRTDNEVGVSWTLKKDKPNAEAWFRPYELRPVDRAHNPRSGRTTASDSEGGAR